MDGKNGMRFIMVNGDLDDPQWAVKSTEEHTLSLYAFHEAALASREPAVDDPHLKDMFNLMSLGIYAIKGVARDTQDPSVITYAASGLYGERGSLFRMFYPYDSISQDYSENRNPSPHVSDIVIPTVISKIEDLMKGKKLGMSVFFDTDLVATPYKAELKRLFMEWVGEYQAGLKGERQNDVRRPAVYLPMESELRALKAMFLGLENMGLCQLGESLGFETDKLPVVVIPDTGPADEGLISDWIKKNNVIYSTLPPSPVIAARFIEPKNPLVRKIFRAYARLRRRQWGGPQR